MVLSPPKPDPREPEEEKEENQINENEDADAVSRCSRMIEEISQVSHEVREINQQCFDEGIKRRKRSLDHFAYKSKPDIIKQEPMPVRTSSEL